MYVSVTRLRLHSPIRLFRFSVLNRAAARQARRAPGLREVRFAYRLPLTFCTLTLWNDRESMLAYRNSAHHLRAMTRAQEVGDGEVHGWVAEALPTWPEAFRRLDAEISRSQ